MITVLSRRAYRRPAAVAVGGGGGTARTDDYNRNNGSDLGSFPTPSGGGSAWNMLTGAGMFFNAGVLQPYLNIMNYAALDCGSPDGTVEILTLAHVFSHLVICRAVDVNNLIYAQFFTTGTAQLRQIVAGSDSQISTSRSVSSVSGDVLGVQLSGTTVQLLKNGSAAGAAFTGVSVTAGIDAAIQHGCGFAGNSADQIDTFTYTP